MNKKTYKLSDIEKFLTYIPRVFLLILTILSIIATHFIIEYRQKSEIALLTQKQKFINQTRLNSYIDTVNIEIKKQLNSVEDELKKNIHTLKGIQTGVSSSYSVIQTYIKKIENDNNMHFVIFDKDLNILHGRKIVQNLQQLIFNQKNDPTYLSLVLLYISSQGESSSFSWKDDIKKTIQLSYFEKSTDGNLFMGAFSSVDSLHKITSKAYLNSLRKDQPDGFYFWLYDYAKKNAFNLNNKKRWEIAISAEKNSIHHNFDKYQFLVGITQKELSTQKSIENIKKEFEDKKKFVLFIIILITLLLITFTVLFLNFIRNIFASYNKSFENKNTQLKKLKQRYELAVIASNDGLWDTNFKTGKTFFSQKWLDILGYKEGDLTSYEDWFNIVHEKDKKLIATTMKEHKGIKKDEHLICEYRLRTKNNDYKWILARGKIFMDNDGNPERLLMMSMDIDEKKEATKHLKALVKKEVAKNEEKQKLLIQQNKLAAMGEMIGSIAHQWRQPLNNVSLIIHFIRDNIKNDDFKNNMLNSYVDRAKEQITYMSETIDDFRDFYKPSKNIEIFDVKEAINSTLSIMQTQIDQNDIVINLQGKSLHVKGYENEFKQAILNILSNAKDAIVAKKQQTPSFKGEITIGFKERTITIANNGGCASKEVIERMFEPYFTTKFEDKGTGIGLYMTKTIIETSMKGTIVAKNSEDGVVFVITIPS